MTESTAIEMRGRVGDDLRLRASLQSPAGAEDQATGFPTLRGGIALYIGQSDGYHDKKTLASTLRLATIVGELLTAVQSLLQGDRKSAAVSVDRVAEMMDASGDVGTAAATAGSPKSNKIVPVIRGGLAPWQVRRVTAHIESHLDEPITTQDLATIAKVSTYHFTRAFRESLSETPHEYVMRRRVERAQGLMLTTNMALGRIAIDCGFADQAHFNKLFRRLAGESPGAWRRARVIPPLGADIHAIRIKPGACK